MFHRFRFAAFTEYGHDVHGATLGVSLTRGKGSCLDVFKALWLLHPGVDSALEWLRTTWLDRNIDSPGHSTIHKMIDFRQVTCRRQDVKNKLVL